jgi:hypothetical protein
MVLDRILIARSAAFAALLASLSCVNAQEPQPKVEPEPVSTAAPPTPVQPPTQDTVVTETPAQPGTPPADETTPGEVPDIKAQSEASAPPPSEPPKIKVCEDQEDLRAWIDKLHSSLYRFSCSSVSWFDGLFGSRQFDDEYRATHGTVTAGGLWSEHDGFDKTLRFRIRLYFPQIAENFNAFVGRADRNDFVDESRSELFALPNQFNSGLDDSVFVGLGVNEKMKKRGSFDFDAGVRISNPIDPYVKGSYRYSRPVGDVDLLRFRETLFWQKREGFGTSLLVEWSHVFDRDNLLRWTNNGLFSENSIGMRWFSDLNLYHLINSERAIALEMFANGSTYYEVPLTTYGTAVIFRQRVWRKWLYLELRTGVDWPRNFLGEERKLNPNGALTFEMRFGQE